MINIFKKHKNILIEINSPLMPLDRGELYEDPLIDLFYEDDDENCFAEIEGSQTVFNDQNEIQKIEIYLKVKKKNYENYQKRIIQLLTELGIPKGSSLTCDDKKIEIGKTEGVKLILDGINLSEDVYCNYNLEDLKKTINSKFENKIKVHGERTFDETSELYIYGESHLIITPIIKDFIETHPLCKNSKIVTLQTCLSEFETNHIIGMSR